MSPFSSQWIALCREAAIAGQLISAGLAALRKANYAATGLYSHAFFSLSIGLERLLKLIFIIDHAIQNGGKYPTERDLRTKFGHNLDKLFAHAKSVHQRLPNKRQRYELPPDGVENDILRFLATFATSMRYYNLDYLVSGRETGTSIDPIAEWFGAIGGQILAKHYSQRQRQKDAQSAGVAEALLGKHALVRHTAEDGSLLTNIQSAALQTGKNKVIQKYGTFYCAKIARFLYMILYDLVYEAHRARLEIPYLYEFFFPFMNDDAYLLSRKTFPPPGQ